MSGTNLSSFMYNIKIDGPDGSVIVDWGNEPNWMKEHKEALANANRIWLTAKNKPSNLPNVCVQIAGERRWILFSRVFGRSGKGVGFDRQVRVYAIGWQETVDGKNVKNISWIYPSGEIEIAEEPGFVGIFFDLLNQ